MGQSLRLHGREGLEGKSESITAGSESGGIGDSIVARRRDGIIKAGKKALNVIKRRRSGNAEQG